MGTLCELFVESHVTTAPPFALGTRILLLSLPVFDPPDTWAHVPKHKVVETDAEVILYVDLPGCKKQHVDATISDDGGAKTLRVTAQRTRHGLPDRTPDATRRSAADGAATSDEGASSSPSPEEGSAQSFEISFALGEGIDASRVRGTLEDGVLTLVLPRLPPEPPAQPIDVPIEPPSGAQPKSEPIPVSPDDDSGAGGGKTAEATKNTHISLL